MAYDYDLATLELIARSMSVIGRDGDAVQVLCRSFTGRQGNDGSPIDYEIRIDLASHETTCSCPDACCRKKVWHHHAPNSRGCKHIEAARRVIVPVLRGAGLI